MGGGARRGREQGGYRRRAGVGRWRRIEGGGAAGDGKQEGQRAASVRGSLEGDEAGWRRCVREGCVRALCFASWVG